MKHVEYVFSCADCRDISEPQKENIPPKGWGSLYNNETKERVAVYCPEHAKKLKKSFEEDAE